MTSITGTNIHPLEEENRKLRQQLALVHRERIEYLQNVSHQLVAPLNAIKWHIENITQARVSIERGKKVLRSIYSQATVAVHLAKNFALMSNLEADHSLTALREPLQAVNLCQLLVNLADNFQPQGWDKEIDISVENPTLDLLPQVLVIKPLISQVFSNIIENAVKYSARKSLVSISGSYDAKVDMVTVHIQNDGIPIKADEINRVFDRGYRSQEAKSAYPAGTGFGLYIAKRIVDIHEGSISCSMEHKGRVVFSVALPVKALEGKTRQRAPKDRPAGR
jgi:two-component system sensor histidine kinase SenX3